MVSLGRRDGRVWRDAQEHAAQVRCECPCYDARLLSVVLLERRLPRAHQIAVVGAVRGSAHHLVTRKAQSFFSPCRDACRSWLSCASFPSAWPRRPLPSPPRMQQVRVGWPAPRCTSCRCSCHSSAFALTFTHFCGLPHSTHGSTSQCLAAHCTFALSPRLLLASCPCTTPTEQVRECCSPTPALGEQPSRLMRLDPFHHFANLSPSNRIAWWRIPVDGIQILSNFFCCGSILWRRN